MLFCCIKNNKYINILLIILSLLILFYIIRYLYTCKIPLKMFNGSNYAPKNIYGFSGVNIKELIQKPQFYSQKRIQTINYLLAVYPNAKESLESLGDLELASFFNSLSYYYNCQFQSQSFSPLPCASTYSLPYPPQGWFYNYYTFQRDNVPFVYSDSDESKDYLQLTNFGSGNPNFAFKSPDRFNRAGPGLFYFNPRTIQRNIWYPNGLSFIFENGKQKWNYVSGQKISWNFPQKWHNGLDDHSFIEVTHTQPVPGITQSPGFWWNAVTGSGIFLNLGKSLRVRNKLEAVYTLLKKMKSDFLMKYFQTDDIYQILFNIIGNCHCKSHIINCSDNCGPDYEGVLKASGLPISDFYTETVRFQKEKSISNEDHPTKEGIKEAIYSAIEDTDYRLNRISSKILLDEPIFFLGIHTNYDTVQMTVDPNINGFYVFEIVDLRMPKEYIQNAKNRDYSQFLNLSQQMDKNNYKDEYIQAVLNLFVEKEILSVRDPLDIFNKDKVKTCIGINNLGSICSDNLNYGKRWYNLYCENVPLSNEYKCLGLGSDIENCDLSSKNPSC